jgi:hypothetical protein
MHLRLPRLKLLLSVAMSGALIAPVAMAEDLTPALASSAPTPCLDAVLPLTATEIQHNGALSYVQGVARGGDLSAAWAPGNRYFDEAYRLVLSTLQRDATVSALLAKIDAKSYIRTQLRRASSQEQQYLKSFFSQPEGRVYWTFMLDGASCAGLLQGLRDRRVPLSARQLEVATNWESRLAGTKSAFGVAFQGLNTRQRANFEIGYKLLRSLSQREAPDERDFQLSIVGRTELDRAVPESVEKIGPRIVELIGEFKSRQ